MGDFLMSSFFVKQFINNMTYESGIKFAKNQGITFSMEEAKYIVPFLKQNVNYIDKEHKEKLLSKIKKEVPLTTYNKITALLGKIT